MSREINLVAAVSVFIDIVGATTKFPNPTVRNICLNLSVRIVDSDIPTVLAVLRIMQPHINRYNAAEERRKYGILACLLIGGYLSGFSGFTLSLANQSGTFMTMCRTIVTTCTGFVGGGIMGVSLFSDGSLERQRFGYLQILRQAAMNRVRQLNASESNENAPPGGPQFR